MLCHTEQKDTSVSKPTVPVKGLRQLWSAGLPKVPPHGQLAWKKSKCYHHASETGPMAASSPCPPTTIANAIIHHHLHPSQHGSG